MDIQSYDKGVKKGLAQFRREKKADYIENEIKKGYSTIYFMDDSPKNIRAVDALKRKYPKVKLITKLA